MRTRCDECFRQSRHPSPNWPRVPADGPVWTAKRSPAVYPDNLIAAGKKVIGRPSGEVLLERIAWLRGLRQEPVGCEDQYAPSRDRFQRRYQPFAILPGQVLDDVKCNHTIEAPGLEQFREFTHIMPSVLGVPRRRWIGVGCHRVDPNRERDARNVAYECPVGPAAHIEHCPTLGE